MRKKLRHVLVRKVLDPLLTALAENTNYNQNKTHKIFVQSSTDFYFKFYYFFVGLWLFPRPTQKRNLSQKISDD
jgi:hypothetical protein